MIPTRIRAFFGGVRLEVIGEWEGHTSREWRTLFCLAAEGADARALVEDVIGLALAPRVRNGAAMFGVTELCDCHPPVEILSAVLCNVCGVYRLPGGPIERFAPTMGAAHKGSLSVRVAEPLEDHEISGPADDPEPTLLDQARAVWARALVVLIGRELASWG